MRDSLNRVKVIVDTVRDIEDYAKTKGSKAAKYITDRCNTIARDELKRLNIVIDKQTGKLLSKPNCSHRYYAKIMEDYRNGIKALNFKHHAIEKHVKAFVKKYSGTFENISEMLNPELPIQDLRNNLIKLRADSVTGSQFRRDLLNLKIEHHAFYMFETKGAIKDWISDDSNKSLKKKLRNQILINPEWVKEKANELLTKEEPSLSDLAIGIAIASGRRPTEVMKSAKLKAVNDATLLFTGQLKTKNRHLFEEIKPYEIPSLIKSEVVVKALRKLRKMTKKEVLVYRNVLGEEETKTVGESDHRDYYHNEAIKKKYASTLNRAVKIVLGDGHFSFHNCRALYTEVTYDEHAKPGESRTAYRHRVLGHSLIETQIHYDSFKVDESIESVKVIVGASDDVDDNVQAALLEHLKKSDKDVEGYVRAPKMLIIHEWLKGKVKDGLKLDEITASYIRRFCLIDGKQTNLNTIKKYLHDFAKLEEFKPPKEKPKNEVEIKIQELESEIEGKQDRASEIADDIDDLDNEKMEIKDRLVEIENEKIELENENEQIEDEIGEIEHELDLLKEQLEKVEQDDEDDEDDEDSEIDDDSDLWPDFDEIEYTCKKSDGGWACKAVVNGIEFELINKGKKSDAIKAFEKYYIEQTEC